MPANFGPFLPLAIALVAVTFTACTSVPEDEEQMLRDTFGGVTHNSPEIDDAPFPELSLADEPNSAGVTLIGLRDPANQDTYPLGIVGRDELAVYKDSETVLYRRDDLLGWTLVLEKDGDELEGTILTYDGAVPGWTDDGRPFTAYAIWFYDPILGTAANVCPTYHNTPAAPVLTLIPGATYDRELKVLGLTDDDWVTFACADQAAYKAKALGYEQGVPFAATTAPATREQQDATLKMITADYCGTGHSFTVQGTPIHWENTAGTVTIPVGETVGPLEAVWDDEGAICLGTPRHVTIAEVLTECPDMPSCNSMDWQNEPHEWVTWKHL